MKINLKDLTKAIEEQTYLSDMESIKYAEVSRSKKKLREHALTMVQEVATALKKDRLMQVQLVLEGKSPVTFALETNIINLPLVNYKKLINFFDEDEAQPVNVYFETANDQLNASHFRIDLFMTGEELTADVEGAADRLADAMSEKLKQIKENEAAAKEAAKEAKAKEKEAKAKEKAAEADK
ncbi:hypothetical protein lacNasYZ03_09830 [Lactobacillus nasalidis]|uniref:DUF2589 domain-containing protein n=1 Tax=Lactobacillus nasalidis TaxID=2797258 RepID=A0ABQ3W6Z4_9LACO|nr:hypothetical protein [Lactobacillus nasalidis]GHV96876.1 hypothetical protein lacNasYZ01_00580 [Lactobacillus nasalidis]GHW00168.1 hypothetical protein lacNasYZ02_15970 [Lactobacillus nasalidis]GHW01296.1 hypothetical protein lacNasYZ03_09830 [Lactobacillus nasalidis]